MTTVVEKLALRDTFASVWQRVEQWLLAIAEHANPILVKETRQALKSRQFLLTFLVILLACWIASFAVVAIAGLDVFYVASGGSMLFVYCAILAFPLMIVVPYSAYRSLASEQEDNTYDLLSITSLNCRQIVTGKLGSAVVQMLVYLSAVSPCIAFTFLLRGVDILTVVLLLCFYFFVSLGLSMAALLVGTMAKVRYTQALTSVLLVIGLLMTFSPCVAMTRVFIDESHTFIRDREFWISIAAAFTLYVTTFLLVHAAASAQIAFASENRSTPLRRLMLLQQACFLGWMSAIPVMMLDFDVLMEVTLMACTVAGIYWYVMGTLLTSEWPHLSRRVQRSLPQSTLGRAFFTWLNPGPGTGFVFSTANLTTIVALGLLLLSFNGTARIASLSTLQAIYFLAFGWCYVVIFLGVGMLLIAVLRRFFYVSMTAGCLIQFILLMLASGIPQLVSLITSTPGGSNTYSLMHITNPMWTLFTLLESGPLTVEASTLILVLPACAIVVLLLNLRAVAAELQYERRSLPQRVAEDEAELHPALVIPGPASPWDAPSEG